MQLKLVQDRIEQMQMVEKAIKDTTTALTKEHHVDWSQMLELIHLTNAENSIKHNIRMLLIFLQELICTIYTLIMSSIGLTGFMTITTFSRA